MGRTRSPFPPKPLPHPRGQSMRCWWNGRWWNLGPAADERAWKAEYSRLVKLWSVDPAAAPLRANDYLVTELCRDYLASADSPAPGRQRERAATAIELLLEDHAGTPVSEFGPAALSAWQAWLCRMPDPGDPTRTRLNRTSVRDLFWAVTRVWKWAVKTERVPFEKYAALLTVEPPKKGEARPPEVVEPADPEHVTATLPFLRPPVRAMVLLQWHAGARPDELCAMTVGEVLRAGRVRVPGASVIDLDKEKVWARAPRAHKLASKGKARILTFGPDAQQILAPFLEGRRPDEYVFRPIDALADLRGEQRAERARRDGGSGGNRKKPAAEPKRRPGSRYSTRTYREAIQRACVKAGVPHWFPYQLRHLAADEINAVFGLDGVMATLGQHTKTMAGHYAGQSFKKSAEIARGRPVGRSAKTEATTTDPKE